MALLRSRMRAISADAGSAIPANRAAGSAKEFHAPDQSEKRAGNPDLKLAPLALKCVVSTCIMIVALFLTESLLNKAFGPPAIPSGSSGAAPAFIGSAISFFSGTSYGKPAHEQAICLAILAVAGAGAYAISAWLLKVSEIRDLARRQRRT
jgi:hypothetical protein